MTGILKIGSGVVWSRKDQRQGAELHFLSSFPRAMCCEVQNPRPGKFISGHTNYLNPPTNESLSVLFSFSFYLVFSFSVQSF